MVQEPTNLLRVVEACHNHQMVGVEEMVHYSQKGVEECGGGALPPGGNGGGNGNGDDNGGGGRPPPTRDMEVMAVMVVMMEMVVEEMIHCHHLIMDSHKHHQGQRDRWVYVVQGPPGPPGQPGQDGRDGWDGQAPQMPRGMINAPGVAPAPLDLLV